MLSYPKVVGNDKAGTPQVKCHVMLLAWLVTRFIQVHWAGSSVANVEVAQECVHRPLHLCLPLGSCLKRYDTPQLPSGFIWKVRLLSSCGDRHYIGLNGVELIDQFDQKVILLCAMSRVTTFTHRASCLDRSQLHTNSMDVFTPPSLPPPCCTQNTSVGCLRVPIQLAS